MNQRTASNQITGFSAAHYQRGLNLIEIMVAMTIGLFLVLGATTLYVNSKKSSDADDAIARLEETARYAMSIIEMDVRMANYWGLVKDGTSITNRPLNDSTTASLTAGSNADNCGTAYVLQVDTPLEGNNNGFPSTFTGSCAAQNAAMPSADTLTVRRASTTGSSSTYNSTSLQVCSNRQTGRLIYGNNSTCPTTDVEYHDVITNIYYVDQQSNQNSSVPSLRRISLQSNLGLTRQEMIAGVEDMQVQFGWASSTDDANVVSYLEPGNSITNGQVVAVRVWLLIRAETPDRSFTNTTTYAYGNRTTTTGTVSSLTGSVTANSAYRPNDNYQRLLVSRTFFVRNAAGT